MANKRLDESALKVALNKSSTVWVKGTYSGENVVCKRGLSTLKYIDEKIAEIKGVDVKTVYDRTWENAEEFFDLSKV